MRNILVFGGTTEGKQVSALLNALELPFVYSTKTEVNYEGGNFGAYRFGAFSELELLRFVNENEISIIIHAAHPFAEVLHETIHKVVLESKVEVLRLERSYPERTNHEKVKYFDCYQELLKELCLHQSKTVLALTGVQTIEKLNPFWNNNRCYFRILNRRSSIDIATSANFPKEQLILEEPSGLIGNEEELIEKLGIDLVLTKESGETGALSDKIKIAIKHKLPIFILKKPTLPSTFEKVRNIEELKKKLSNNFKS